MPYDFDLSAFARTLIDRFPQIQAVYLFGSRARGDHRPDSDYDVFVMAEVDQEDDLRIALMRAEDDLSPKTDGVTVDLFATDGPALLGAWGGGLIGEQVTRQWKEGYDYRLIVPCCGVMAQELYYSSACQRGILGGI